MSCVILSIATQLYSGAIRDCLTIKTGFAVTDTARTSLVAMDAAAMKADLALLEVTARSPYTAEERLALCTTLRMKNPACKLLLLCDRQDADTARKVKTLRANGTVDGFLYTGTSIDYLAAVVEALVPGV